MGWYCQWERDNSTTCVYIVRDKSQFIISLFRVFRCNELEQTHSCLRGRVCTVCAGDRAVRSARILISSRNEGMLKLSIIMICSEARYESKCNLGHFLNTTMFYFFLLIICQIFQCAKILTLSLDQWTSHCDIQLWSISFRYLTRHGAVSKSV